MVRHAGVIVRVLLPVALLACGGDGKKTPKKPSGKGDAKANAKAETPADREAKRHAAALALIPEGTSCLPAALKEPNAPQLELAAIGSDAIVCAHDTDRLRLLGLIACWKIDLASGDLTYQAATPQPGRSFAVKLEGGCARDYCLPKDAKPPADGIAYVAWNQDGKKVAVLAGDDVHLFDAESKTRDSGFSVRGDKGVAGEPTGLHWISEVVFVEGKDSAASGVWVFKTDGTQVGPIEGLGGKDPKPLSTHGGSFVTLDKARVAIAEQGFSTVTTYEADTGKRAKIVRKVAKAPCKPAELDAFWKDTNAAAAPKCKEFLTKNFAHLVGADAVAGKTNLLVLLRGPRLGELAVLEAKTLVEKKSIKLPWCDAGGGTAGGAGDDAASDAKAASPKDTKETKAKSTTRGATKKPPAKAEDPDAGGE
ncbi:MAG: hypothetical protein H6Q90_3594 [Deltaproteobacteria bacterium]|nr:hypothetical protein [Deltaproteobacteria bacterium]